MTTPQDKSSQLVSYENAKVWHKMTIRLRNQGKCSFFGRNYMVLFLKYSPPKKVNDLRMLNERQIDIKHFRFRIPVHSLESFT